MCSKKTLQDERALAREQVLDELRYFIKDNARISSRYGQFRILESLDSLISSIEACE